jgi:hypothetical protein
LGEADCGEKIEEPDEVGKLNEFDCGDCKEETKEVAGVAVAYEGAGYVESLGKGRGVFRQGVVTCGGKGFKGGSRKGGQRPGGGDVCPDDCACIILSCTGMDKC